MLFFGWPNLFSRPVRGSNHLRKSCILRNMCSGFFQSLLCRNIRSTFQKSFPFLYGWPNLFFRNCMWNPEKHIVLVKLILSHFFVNLGFYLDIQLYFFSNIERFQLQREPRVKEFTKINRRKSTNCKIQKYQLGNFLALFLAGSR